MTLLTQSLPSIMTLGSLFCGLLSAVYTLEGSEEGLITAAWLIIAAMLFDGLDGKVSRMFKTQSHFGVELDSIVDVCSFGFAPALLSYQFIITHLSAWQAIAFPVSFVFVACGALRLARFNAQLKGFDKASFKGMPIPAAAVVVASFVVFIKSDLMAEASIEWMFPFIALLTATLMVSRIKYDTFPRFAWSSMANRIKLVIFFSWLVLAAFYPAEAFFPLGVLYVSWGLTRAAIHLMRGREEVALDDPTLEPTRGRRV